MAAFEERIMAGRKPTKAVVPKPKKKPAYITQIETLGVSPDMARDARTKMTENEAYAKALREVKTPKAPVASVGGGKASKPKDTSLDDYVRSIQGLLQSGEYLKPQEQLKEQLQTMYGQAQTGVNTAMDNLQSFLQGQANPYEGFKAQAAQVSPQLMEFLQSQGASTDPLQQLAAVRQQEATNQAAAFQNLGDTLKTLAAAQQSGRIGDVAQQRATYQSALEGAKAGYGTQLDETSFNRRNELLKLLLGGVAKGGRPGKGSLVGVGPGGLSLPQAPAQQMIPDLSMLGISIPGMGTF